MDSPCVLGGGSCTYSKRPNQSQPRLCTYCGAPEAEGSPGARPITGEHLALDLNDGMGALIRTMSRDIAATLDLIAQRLDDHERRIRRQEQRASEEWLSLRRETTNRNPRMNADGTVAEPLPVATVVKGNK